MQPSSRNCCPDPDLLFVKLISPRVLSSGGMYFSQTPVCRLIVVALAADIQPMCSTAVSGARAQVPSETSLSEKLQF